MAKKALVKLNGVAAGILQNEGGTYEFTYLSSYLASENALPVSYTLPLRSQPYQSQILHPFFDGLIPEGWLLNLAVDYFKIKQSDRYGLLMAYGADTIGAVSVHPIAETDEIE